MLTANTAPGVRSFTLVLLLLWISGAAGCGDRGVDHGGRRASGLPAAGPGVGSKPAIPVLAQDPQTASVVRSLSGDGIDVVEQRGHGAAPQELRGTMAQPVLALVWGSKAPAADLRLWAFPPQNLPPVGLTQVGVPGWHEPAPARSALATMASLLPKLVGPGADAVRERIARLDAQLSRVHAYGITRTATIPPRRRLLVTHGTHLGGFARAFRLEHLRWTRSGDPKLFAKRMVEASVDTVFLVDDADPLALEPLRAAMASAGVALNTAGPLRTDFRRLQEPWQQGIAGMLDHNITTVVSTLGGQVPAGGLAMREAALKASGGRPR